MLFFAYLLAAIALWLKCTLLPQIPLIPFAPFLALSSLRCPLDKAIGCSVVAGIGVDLLSSDPLGVHALTYSLATALCYRLRNLFSAEAPSQYAMFTGLISAALTLVHILLLFLFDRRVPFCGLWWITDWAVLPIVDAVYALIWFAGPLALMQTIYRRWVIFWLKRKNPFPT